MPETPRSFDRILRRPEVLARTGLSITTLTRLEAAGEFPQHKRLSTRTIGWLERDVEAWIAARVA